MAKNTNTNVDVTEFVKRIARSLEKPPEFLVRGTAQKGALRKATYQSHILDSQTRGVVGVQGEGDLRGGA